MTHLLDGSVLIPLALERHIHHVAARQWWEGARDPFATCPITQGTLARGLLREGWSGRDVANGLRALFAHPRHRFWPDDIGYDTVDLTRVLGHSRVADAYVAELARRRGARVATFDQGLAEREPEVSTLIPVAPPGR